MVGTTAGTFTCSSQATAYAVADVTLFGESYLGAGTINLDFGDGLCGVGGDKGWFNTEFGVCSLPLKAAAPKVYLLAG